MHNIFLIFLGGGVGSVARYALMNAVSRLTPGVLFPWPTLGVNITGALLIGILLELLALRTSLSGAGKFLLITGFLGGFTTFSAFSLDAALMFERGDFMNMALYIAASVIGTIMAVFIGSGIVKAMI
jgi:CrcB protein